MTIQRPIAIVIFITICLMQTTIADVPITITRNVLSYRTLQVGIIDTAIKFTWEAKRATTNITLTHSDDVDVTMEEHKYGEFRIIVMLNQTNSSAVKTHGPSPLAVIATLAPAAVVSSRLAKWQMFILGTLYLFSNGYAETTIRPYDTMLSVHLVVPSDVIETICINGVCWPVLCKLSPNSEYSNVPSNSPIFLDNKCTIKKPERWDEWLTYYFGNDSVQETYYGDFDEDGLVNLLEYYGWEAFGNRPYGQTDNQTEGTTEIPPVSSRGTKPTNPDTDGDLLTDGFEVYNSLNPNRKDETQADYDKDSLKNLDEQIQQLDPLNPDSDGDGIPDGEEVERGGDPRNPTDAGKKSPDELMAVIRLTVGDHSGSHSERYVLHVGHISHQSPGFGLVGSGEYKFRPGTYRITLQHAGTILSTPDYDYTAYVQKISGEARVRIEDPQRILGRHHESRYFYAQGKSASLIVEANCTGEDCKCAKLKSCDQCVTNPDPECEWNKKEATCVDKSFFNWWGYVTDINECPCKKCKDWYDGEKAENSNWLNEVHRQFPCPCQATVGRFGLSPVGTQARSWLWDPACRRGGGCTYHPGAFGCLRSAGKTSAGAGQQCCYGGNANAANGAVLQLLPPEHNGTGTPDRGHSLQRPWQHKPLDVDPFDWCCKECKQTNYCDHYMELRRGNNSHCNK